MGEEMMDSCLFARIIGRKWIWRTTGIRTLLSKFEFHTDIHYTTTHITCIKSAFLNIFYICLINVQRDEAMTTPKILFQIIFLSEIILIKYTLINNNFPYHTINKQVKLPLQKVHYTSNKNTATQNINIF